MRQLHYQDRQSLDDDVRHLHAADGQCHHALAGTAVDEALLQAINHLTLREVRHEIHGILAPAQEGPAALVYQVLPQVLFPSFGCFELVLGGEWGQVLEVPLNA